MHRCVYVCVLAQAHVFVCVSGCLGGCVGVWVCV